MAKQRKAAKADRGRGSSRKGASRRASHDAGQHRKATSLPPIIHMSLEDICPICDGEIADEDEWTIYEGEMCHLKCVERD